MWRRTWLVFSQAVTVAVAVLFVVVTLKPQWLTAGRGSGAAALLPSPTVVQVAQAPAVAASGVVVGGFSLAARRAAPAVVSVTATKLTRNPHADDPRFRFFFGDRPPTQQQVGLGSVSYTHLTLPTSDLV